MIIYTKNTGASAVSTSKLETPIKMIIQHESDLITRKGGICDSLFNIEKSNRFGETIVGGNEFSLFAATEEGMAAEDSPITGGYEKFIEHIQFMKEFAISAEMMEDANYGIAADAKRRAENFTRAYYKTINKICETALLWVPAQMQPTPTPALTLPRQTVFPSSTQVTSGAQPVAQTAHSLTISTVTFSARVLTERTARRHSRKPFTISPLSCVI